MAVSGPGGAVDALDDGVPVTTREALGRPPEHFSMARAYIFYGKSRYGKINVLGVQTWFVGRWGARTNARAGLAPTNIVLHNSPVVGTPAS